MLVGVTCDERLRPGGSKHDTQNGVKQVANCCWIHFQEQASKHVRSAGWHNNASIRLLIVSAP